MGARATRGIRGDWGGSELLTNHSRPHALGSERGCGDKGKNARGQLTFDPRNRGCKPLQDKRARRDSPLKNRSTQIRDPRGEFGQFGVPIDLSVSDANCHQRSVMPSGCGDETIHRRSGDPRFRPQRCTARRDRARPCRGAARRRAGPQRTGSPVHACSSGPSGSGLLSRPRHEGSPPRELALGRESCAQWTRSSGPNSSGAFRATPLPRTTRRCPWPAGPLQPWPLANRLEEFLRGFRHPDQALASFCDHTLVTEEVHCSIQTLPGCGMAPVSEGREESVAAHRTAGLLQRGENVFDRLESWVRPRFCISWRGGFQDLCHGCYYTYLSSICILSPHARNYWREHQSQGEKRPCRGSRISL